MAASSSSSCVGKSPWAPAPESTEVLETSPQWLLLHIFRYLSPWDQKVAMCVCRSWRQVGEDDTLKNVRKLCFGKAAWKKHFGDVGVEPPLPPSIHKILSKPCPFWPSKRIGDTHLLTLIPQAFSGSPFSLNALGDLIRTPIKGHATKYRSYDVRVENELGTKPAPASHWVLMTRNVIPRSRGRSYEDQKKLIKLHAEKIRYLYTLPTAIEAATSIVMEYVRTKTLLYTDDPWTYTYSTEKVGNGEWTVIFGGFCTDGLAILNNRYYDEDYGAAGSLRF